ncbi:signal peptidase II [Ehrlichia sp. JZT12]
MKRYILIICLLIFIDQLSKWYVINLLKNVDVIEVFNCLQLTTVWNTGISFGIWHNFVYSNIVFCIISTVITFVLFFLLVLRSFDRLPLSVIIGGSIGNIVDRVRYGAVYDFIDFYVNTWHWPAFNLADSFIFLGVVIILRKSIVISKFKNS